MDEKKFVSKIYVARLSDDKTPRENLTHVFFKDGNAYASDGHILARVPVDSITLNISEEELKRLDGKCIHRDVFKQLLKYKQIEIREDCIVATLGHHTITYSLIDESEMASPGFEKVIEEENTKERTPVTGIGINTEFLNDLAIAMGCASAVKLDFTSYKSKIYVTDTSQLNDALGVIMPTVIEPVLEGFE